jgi:hypothetical protein
MSNGMMGKTGCIVNGKQETRGDKSIGCLAYLRIVWADLASSLFVALLMGAVYSIPMSYNNDRIVPMSSWKLDATTDANYEFRPPIKLAHRWRKEPVPSWVCGMLDILVPIFVISIF